MLFIGAFHWIRAYVCIPLLGGFCIVVAFCMVDWWFEFVFLLSVRRIVCENIASKNEPFLFAYLKRREMSAFFQKRLVNSLWMGGIFAVGVPLFKLLRGQTYHYSTFNLLLFGSFGFLLGCTLDPVHPNIEWKEWLFLCDPIIHH
jgi:hypothetical protein